MYDPDDPYNILRRKSRKFLYVDHLFDDYYDDYYDDYEDYFDYYHKDDDNIGDFSTDRYIEKLMEEVTTLEQLIHSEEFFAKKEETKKDLMKLDKKLKKDMYKYYIKLEGMQK